MQLLQWSCTDYIGLGDWDWESVFFFGRKFTLYKILYSNNRHWQCQQTCSEHCLKMYWNWQSKNIISNGKHRRQDKVMYNKCTCTCTSFTYTFHIIILHLHVCTVRGIVLFFGTFRWRDKSLLSEKLLEALL